MAASLIFGLPYGLWFDGAAQQFGGIPLVANGVAYTANLTETITFSESIAVLFAATQSLTETVPLGEAQTTTFGANVSLSELVTLSDAVTVVYHAISGLNDTVTLSEALAVIYKANQALTETVNLSDAVTAAYGAVLGLSETTPLSEGLGIVYHAASTLIESIALIENLGVTVPAVVGLNETVVVAETVNLLQAFVVTLSEMISWFESVFTVYTPLIVPNGWPDGTRIFVRAAPTYTATITAETWRTIIKAASSYTATVEGDTMNTQIFTVGRGESRDFNILVLGPDGKPQDLTNAKLYFNVRVRVEDVDAIFTKKSLQAGGDQTQFEIADQTIAANKGKAIIHVLGSDTDRCKPDDFYWCDGFFVDNAGKRTKIIATQTFTVEPSVTRF